MARYISTTGLNDISLGTQVIEADETGGFEIADDIAVDNADALVAHGFVLSNEGKSAPVKPPVIPPSEEKPETVDGFLIGSSVQPSSFTLVGGQRVQLGAVVAEAYARSGMTVEQWNAQDNVHREMAIADVVAELPPVEI